MTRIERLTPEQEVILAQFHNEWLGVGLCTEPADRPRAEQAISALSGEIGHAPPRFVWCESPMTSVLALKVLWERASLRDSLWDSLRDSLRDSLGDSLGDSLWDSLRDSLRDSLGASLRDSLGDSLWASLGDSLGDSLWASLGDSVWDSLWASLRDSLRDSLGDSLGDSLWDSLGDSLRDSLRDSLGASLRDSLGDSLWASLGDSLGDSLWDSLGDSLYQCFWGQHEAAWIAFYRFPEQHLGVRYDPRCSRQLALWEDIARSCCWWWPYEGICIVSERPSLVRMESRAPGEPVGGRLQLHCDHGPAVAFRDGWGVWAWHGVRVPQHVIETPADQLDARAALAEPNVEVRRVLAERIGWDRLLRDTDAQEIHRDDFGTLYHLPVKGDEPLALVRVVNGTPNPDGSFDEYTLSVSPWHRTALSAVASTYPPLTPEEYARLACRT